MFKILFKIIITLVSTVLSLILTPINALVTGVFPDISTKILQVTSGISNLFSGLSYAMGFIPQPIIEVLLFIITCEIAKHTIHISTHLLIKIWVIIQKIKFW